MRQSERAMSTIVQWIRQPAVARRALLVALILGVVYWLVIIIISVTLIPPHGSDFAIYYAAAEVVRFTPGADLYSWPALAHIAQAHVGCALFPGVRYVYPPLLALMLEPLTLVPCGLAMPIWTLVNAALWAGATALLARQLYLRWHHSRLATTTLVVLASACCWQALWGLWLGQVHLLVFFSLVLAMELDERDHPYLAGGMLALAACVKFFPAFLVFYYLLRGKWKPVVGAVISGMLCVLVMCAAVGVPTVLRGLPVAARVVGDQARPGLNEALVIVVPGVGLVLAVLVLALFCTGVVATKGHGDNRLGFAWTICTMLLISPLVWSYYLVWLLPVFVACLGTAWSSDKRLLALLAVLYGIVAFPTPLALHPLATLILWVITGVLFLRSVEASAPLVWKPWWARRAALVNWTAGHLVRIMAGVPARRA